MGSLRANANCVTSDSQFVVHRSEDRVKFGGCVGALLPRLAHSASNLAAEILALEIVGVHIRADNPLARHRVAARRIFRSAAFGSHGATSVAHVRRPAAYFAGRAFSSPAAGASKNILAAGNWPILNMARVGRRCLYSCSSGGLLGCDGRDALRLACARGL